MDFGMFHNETTELQGSVARVLNGSRTAAFTISMGTSADIGRRVELGSGRQNWGGGVSVLPQDSYLGRERFTSGLLRELPVFFG